MEILSESDTENTCFEGFSMTDLTQRVVTNKPEKKGKTPSNGKQVGKGSKKSCKKLQTATNDLPIAGTSTEKESALGPKVSSDLVNVSASGSIVNIDGHGSSQRNETNVTDNIYQNMLVGMTEMISNQNNLFTQLIKSRNQSQSGLIEDLESPPVSPSISDQNQDTVDEVDICTQIDNVLMDTAPEAGITDVLLQDIQQLYADDSDCGPDINQKVADLINNLLCRKIPDSKLNKTGEEYKRPQNCMMMVTPRVNAEIWAEVQPNHRSSDIKFQKIQDRLTKGLIPLTTLVNDLNIMRKSSNLQFDSEEMGKMIRKLCDSLAFLAAAHFEISMKRRENLKSSNLNIKIMSRLCSVSNRVTQNLFGDDLPKSIKDISEVSRVGQNVQPRRLPFNARRPFPYQRPYNSQQTNYKNSYKNPASTGTSHRYGSSGQMSKNFYPGRGRSRKKPN
ncbi:hypothetical protein SNE40_016714 [Patella caerulea]|uniref:Uncharacterized protein n=2 Tax=Patella caerulea TaxID=87958 RepID=A0AAN8JF86_PATCE